MNNNHETGTAKTDNNMLMIEQLTDEESPGTKSQRRYQNVGSGT